MKKKEATEVSYKIEVTRAKQFDDGTVVFDMVINGITIYGSRVVEGKNGDFISFPARKGKDDNYYNHVWCKLSADDTKEIISQIEKLI